MLSAVRKCLNERTMKNVTYSNLKKSVRKKIKMKAMPVFQYPVSQVGDRRVYVWGLAEHGALGTIHKMSQEENIRYTAKPKRLTFGELHQVTDVACGYGFSAFAVSSSDKNIVYASGINTDSQLGLHEMDKRFPDSLITIPRPVPLPIENSATRVMAMAAGRAHLLILTSEGLFTLGNNAYGQCGRPVIVDEDYKNSAVVHRITDIKGNRITSVTAGQDHSVLLLESGEVYTFGWGADGQTGLAHYQNEYRPSLVKGGIAGERIVKVACSADCVLALSERGKVYGWGNSEYDQLPLDDDDNRQVNIAMELQMSEEVGRVVDIATGGSFCMILNDEGKVYVWGYGILGLGPRVERIRKPTVIPPTLFGMNEYNKDTKVASIHCGLYHLAALTNSGDLYMWGCNKFGSLGLGHRNDQYFPLKVAIGAHVKKVACGIDHTVTLCKPFV